MHKSAFITGICGQDGYYLTRLLLDKGYAVFGTDTPTAMAFEDARSGLDGATLVEIDLEQREHVEELLSRFRFSEIYNLAAVSFIPASWEDPYKNFEVNARIPLNLLEAIRKNSPATRIFQACSSELFGDCTETPQTEETPFHPRSPYSINKIYAYHLIQLYREYRDVFAVNGILYNHESPRRPENFVTRKITSSAVRIKLGLQDKLKLGDLDSQRDWGFAGDVVRAMWLTLNAPKADEYVIATGKLHSVRDFCHEAFACLDLDYSEYVESDPRFVREEHSILQGDPTRIRTQLGWEPEVDFPSLVRMMVEHDQALLGDNNDSQDQ